MAYVSVPKDLTKVKNKLAFNLTKRQLICFGIAALIGLPVYFLTRGVIGNSNAATVMVFLMLPAFLFAMYEKDGMPLEKVLKNMIMVKFKRPAIRRYETDNIYDPDRKSRQIRASRVQSTSKAKAPGKGTYKMKEPGKGGRKDGRKR